MTALGVVFLLVAVALILVTPRRLAVLPLIAGACYMTLGQGVELGSLNFPVIRLLILAGFGRIVLRGERLPGGFNRLDKAIVWFVVGALVTALFHADPKAHLIGSAGLAFNVSGAYFLIRFWCATRDDVTAICRMVALVLLPLAAEMCVEIATGRNLFSVLGGVPELSAVREGRIRAQGPFAHAILAGTVGAVSLPLFAALWRRHRAAAITGIVAALTMVVTSASSGPIGSTAAGLVGLAMWRFRERMQYVRRGIVAAYLFLEVAMKAPPYFLLARLDIVGGSTGWHRAELIRSAIEHIGEWWLWGTDYTRHWMETGVSWSLDHADITNHYLQMGVFGGLPLMALFIWSLVVAFSFIGTAVHTADKAGNNRDAYAAWAIGAALFAHVVTCISVAYFDQSIVILCLNLSLAGALHASDGVAVAPEQRSGRGRSNRLGRPVPTDAAPLSAGASAPHGAGHAGAGTRSVARSLR